MLPRLTNAVLMLAVAALTIALVRESKRHDAAQVVAPAPVMSPDDRGEFDGRMGRGDDVLLLTAAFSPLDPSELAGADPDNWGALPTQSTPSTPPSPGAGDADNAHARTPIRDAIREHREDRGLPVTPNGPGSGGGRGGDHARPWDGRGDRGWMNGGVPNGPITEELANRCLEIARDVDPELAQRLASARQQNPEEFERQMRAGGFGRRLIALAQLKARDPILYGDKVSELSAAVQIDRTARQIRELKKDPKASLGKIDELEGNLRTMLQVQFAMSMKARGEMLCRFEDKVAEMRADLEREAKNFQSTIDARMKYLLEDPASHRKQGGAGDEPAAAPVAQPVSAPATGG